MDRRDRLRAFLDFADIHLERGNLDAAREALAEAERLDEEIEFTTADEVMK